MLNLTQKLGALFPIQSDTGFEPDVPVDPDAELPLRERVKKLEPVIQQALNKYVGSNSSLVLQDRARILAAQAIKGFDPTKGAKLSTHVYNQLQRLQREAPVISDPMPMPERFRADQSRIYQARMDIENEEGRDALPEEIADKTHLPLKRVKRVLGRMSSRVTQSAYEESESEEDEAKDLAVSERTPWDEWVDAVYHDLPPRDRLIFRHRTGYDGAEVLGANDLADKLGVTPQIISQRARLIQKRLDSFR